MNDRLVTIAGALVALLLVVGLFLQPADRVPTTLPTSVEVGPNGYRALAGWLASEGVGVISLKEKSDTLAEFDSPGHLLVTTLPHQKVLEQAEITALLRWVGMWRNVMSVAPGVLPIILVATGIVPNARVWTRKDGLRPGEQMYCRRGIFTRSLPCLRA